jgi:ATP synthase F subunit
MSVEFLFCIRRSGSPLADEMRAIQIADRIRYRVDTYTQAFPTILEIPSKDHPYDPEKDSVLRRVRRLFGE